MNMSHDEHEHEKEPMILTSGRRMGKGMLILVITLAVGAAIIVPFFDEMYSNPPPVTQIRIPPPPDGQPQTGGPTVIAISNGAAVQGNDDYDPNNAAVPVEGIGSEIVWDNLDTVPHTATSGTDNNDPDKGKLFDTGIINPNDNSANIVLEGVTEGDVINYFCSVHEYMKGQLTIVASGEGAQAGGAAAGPAIKILQGAAVQGSPDYDPDELSAKKGDEVSVVNQDNVPHTVTSGTANNDPDKGKLFDTGIINAGASGKISLVEVDPGEYDYFCFVHEYMKGKLIVK
jgi:plastocyanin